MQKCTGCNKSFGRAQDLNRHFVIHTGEKPHKCAACNKSFGEAGTLRKHMLTHTGEKPHSCAQCKKSFSQAGNLRAHILTHNAEKSTTWPPQYKKTLPREGRLIARKKQIIWFQELGGRFWLALFDSFIYIDWAQTETNWYLFGPNRNRIVPVITETFRFRFGKWWNLKSSSGVIQKEITN